MPKLKLRKPRSRSSSRPLFTLPKHVHEHLWEVVLVGSYVNALCIGMAFATLLRSSTTFGWLYWPMKIASIVNLFLIPIVQPITPFVGMVVDFVTFYLCSLLSMRLFDQYSAHDIKEQRKYSEVHNFILNYLWALEACFLIRGGILLIIFVRDMLQNDDWRRPRRNCTGNLHSITMTRGA